MPTFESIHNTSDKGFERLYWRRVLFAFLILSTSVSLLTLMATAIFSPAGFDWWGCLMLAMFTLTLPWTTIGFWNAVIGFAVMTFARDPVHLVAPFLREVDQKDSISSKTAICVCTRNESTDRLSRNLNWMLEKLVQTEYDTCFHLYLLSDSTQPDLLTAEKTLAAELSHKFGSRIEVSYRQRIAGLGFKAGNIRDFLKRWGSLHDYMIVLDADSLMSPATMLRLIRTMQVNPQIGILQTLVIALPTNSAFARVFQFGMRLGMRSWTLGSAWWQGDCGPYWGHNAILRIKPFTEYCALPIVPGPPPLGGHILSHDQLEAVFMRKAGYEVRVIPVEGGSWEENPPHLLEFIRRDLRWCHGNMQYFHFVNMVGLLPVSRWQLWQAIGMYLSGPGWMGFTFFAIMRHGPIDPSLGFITLVISLTMSFAPKLATLANVLLRRHLRASFGGTLRILLSACVETIFSMVIAPVVSLSVTLFVIFLPFGKKMSWEAQQRDSEAVSWRFALTRLWPHVILGMACFISLYQLAPGVLWFAAPFYIGLIGAPIFTVVSSSPTLGRWTRRIGLCQLPEETPTCLNTLPQIALL